jgi:hypothetical protein
VKKINIYLIALILGFTLTAGNNAKAAKVEPCMTQTCVDYFNKWKKMSYRKYNTALSVLGELYYQGYGTEKNLDKSFKLFKKAARYNFTYAQYRTGLFYLSEEGYIDTDKGIKFLKKAARNGHAESSFLLAISYGTGELTEKDTLASDQWLDKAINTKHSKAQMYASFLNQNGRLTYRNYPKVSTMIQLLNEGREVIEDKEATVQLAQTKLIKKQESINWPEDSSMEVIQVSAPTVEAIFDNELAYLQVNPPASNGATGTRITGRTCDQMVSCNAVDTNDFERLIMQLWQ